MSELRATAARTEPRPGTKLAYQENRPSIGYLLIPEQSGTIHQYADPPTRCLSDVRAGEPWVFELSWYSLESVGAQLRSRFPPRFVFLGLREDQCYAEVEKALSEVKADFCTIVVPPAVHEMVVDSALAHDLHILSEKPIADTLAGPIRIAEPDRSRSPGTPRSCQCQCK